MQPPNAPSFAASATVTLFPDRRGLAFRIARTLLAFLALLGVCVFLKQTGHIFDELGLIFLSMLILEACLLGAAVWYVAKLVSRQPALMLSPDGLWHNEGIIPIFIPWNQMRGMRIYRIGPRYNGFGALGIDLIADSALLKHPSLARRIILAGNAFLCHPPFTIPLTDFPLAGGDLIDRLREYF